MVVKFIGEGAPRLITNLEPDQLTQKLHTEKAAPQPTGEPAISAK